MCNAPVKALPPTYQHSLDGLSVAQPTTLKDNMKGKKGNGAFMGSVPVAVKGITSPNLISEIFVDFDIFQSNNSIMYPTYYDKMS